MIGDVGIVEEIEGRSHRIAVFVAEQRPDILREARGEDGTEWLAPLGRARRCG